MHVSYPLLFSAAATPSRHPFLLLLSPTASGARGPYNHVLDHSSWVIPSSIRLDRHMLVSECGGTSSGCGTAAGLVVRQGIEQSTGPGLLAFAMNVTSGDTQQLSSRCACFMAWPAYIQ